MSPARFDNIGYWSEVKLDIVRDYAKEYSKILTAQAKPRLHHVYIDGFSGAGVHLAKRTGEYVAGSPLNALNILPPFRDHYLIDMDGDKVEHLRQLAGDRKDVHIFKGDCNDILLTQVFPKVQYGQYKRGLCLLDPYGLHLNWTLIAEAGRMKSIELFVNFPTMDMNRNALWRNPEGVASEDAERMTLFWGNESWRGVAYGPKKQGNLFGEQEMEKASNEVIAEAFRKRLKEVAGFAHVPKPLPMVNAKGAVVYYLFFAAQKPVADKIVQYIFEKHGGKGT